MTSSLSPTLSSSSFPSEMHQGHPCLLCRAASQGHEGTTAFSCFNARGGTWGWRWWLHWMKGHLTDVLTGGRNQGQDPHPHHGVPLWGRHAGHQTGLRQDLWEITLHWHLGQLPLRSVSRGDVGGIWKEYDIIYVSLPGWHLWGLQEAAAEAVRR